MLQIFPLAESFFFIFIVAYAHISKYFIVAYSNGFIEVSFQYRNVPVDVMTTSVLSTVKFHFWSAVKTVLVNRRSVSSLWCEDELFTSNEVPEDWPDITKLQIGDCLIRKIEDVRMRANEGVPNQTARGIPV